jgi:uncharacterized protein YbjT (DUF2867 family)
MRVLITGATGFIGRALAGALEARGHTVVRAGRSASADLQADFASVPDRRWWQPHLADIDVVVNAVGILREDGAQTFEALHARAPAELFAACSAAGVPRVIQVSALGADEQAQSRYHLSKKAADDALRGQPLRSSVIVQPSLVYGAEGSSAALFNKLAALPVLPFPDAGRMAVQPVHVDDVVAGLVALVEEPGTRAAETVPFTGPSAMTLAQYLADLRTSLGFGPRQRVVGLPPALFLASASVAGHLPGSMLDRETAGMLLRGNTAPCDAFAAVLGRLPRPASAFVTPREMPALRIQAVLDLWLPVLRSAIALVWIWTGIVSFGVYPVQDSYELLARVGLYGAAATFALYGAAVLDLALGVLTWLSPARWRGAVWAAQLALIGAYTLLITIFLPEYWLHPYGPILKNLPMMAAIALLWALEPPRTAR